MTTPLHTGSGRGPPPPRRTPADTHHGRHPAATPPCPLTQDPHRPPTTPRTHKAAPASSHARGSPGKPRVHAHGPTFIRARRRPSHSRRGAGGGSRRHSQVAPAPAPYPQSRSFPPARVPSRVRGATYGRHVCPPNPLSGGTPRLTPRSTPPFPGCLRASHVHAMTNDRPRPSPRFPVLSPVGPQRECRQCTASVPIPPKHHPAN